MSDETCELSKWKLLIKHLEKRPWLEGMILATACVGILLIIISASDGIKEASKNFVGKNLCKTQVSGS